MNAREFLKDMDRGLSEKQLAEKHQLSISEVRTTVAEVRTARREALDNRVKGMFLQGFTISELPKYFGLTENEIRLILQPPTA